MSRKVPQVLSPLPLFDELFEKLYKDGDKYVAVLKEPKCKTCKGSKAVKQKKARTAEKIKVKKRK